MTKKRQPLRAAAAGSSKLNDGAKSSKKQKIEDSDGSKNTTTKSSSSSKGRGDDDDDNDDEDDEDDNDDDDEDDDIALEGQLHFTEPITFEFNDPKEEYAESITVLLKQVECLPSSLLFLLYPSQTLSNIVYDFVAETVCTESYQGLFVSESDSESGHSGHGSDL